MIFPSKQIKISGIFLMLINAPLAAQRVGNLSFSPQLAQPVGAFAAIEGNRAGHSGLGPGVSIEIDLPVFPIFNWMTTIGLFATPYSGSDYNGIRPIRLAEHYYYRGVDVLTGLRRAQDVGEGGEIFGFAQIGVRRISAPEFKGVATDIKWRKELVRYQFSALSSFGGSVGLGVLINKKYVLVLRYSYFGNYNFKGLIELNDTVLWEEEVDQLQTNCSTVSISFGVNLRYE